MSLVVGRTRHEEHLQSTLPPFGDTVGRECDSSLLVGSGVSAPVESYSEKFINRRRSCFKRTISDQRHRKGQQT